MDASRVNGIAQWWALAIDYRCIHLYICYKRALSHAHTWMKKICIVQLNVWDVHAMCHHRSISNLAAKIRTIPMKWVEAILLMDSHFCNERLENCAQQIFPHHTRTRGRHTQRVMGFIEWSLSLVTTYIWLMLQRLHAQIFWFEIFLVLALYGLSILPLLLMLFGQLICASDNEGGCERGQNATMATFHWKLFAKSLPS